MTFNVLVATADNEQWSAIGAGIRRQRPEASILRVKDGEQAVRFLFYRGLFTEAPETPDLIVLARELSTVSVESIVARLRQHPRTNATPVIVMTDADDPEAEVVEAMQRVCDDPAETHVSARQLLAQIPF